MTLSLLKDKLLNGLLSFPVTDFDNDGEFNDEQYARRLEWLSAYGASALFVAGGTGEFFSLTPSEHKAIVQVAAEVSAGKVPIIAGTGGPLRVAIEIAKAAQGSGAHGILVMPHYMPEVTQSGLAAYVEQLCKSIDIGVILYNRGQANYSLDTVDRLLDKCPNLIGFKDGVGNIEQLSGMYQKFGDRLRFIGGMPTAEVYASAYKSIDDSESQKLIMEKFFAPFLAIRNRNHGYTVSIIKAGVRLIGKGAGPVRAPLTELHPADVEHLSDLIKNLNRAMNL